ncbi:MAG: oligoendopeptidase F [Clostridiales bacterium]|nr:oligoendopeptidase F [Clostridiales bacterium]
MAEKLLKRSEVATENTWRLEDIYPTNEAWEKELKALSEMGAELTQYKGKLGNRDDALKALKLSDKCDRVASSLYTYARMRRDEDNSNTLYQGMVSKIQQAATLLGSKAAYISPELLSKDEAYLSSLKTDPEFSDFSMMLDDLLRNRPHTLSESEETLLAMSRDVSETASTAYDMLTDADMRFPEIKDENGEMVRLTSSNYIPFMMNKDREVRKAAFTALYETYKSFSATIPALYAGNVNGDIFYARAKKHECALEASLFEDNIPVSVYDSLIEAVNAHLPALQRFVDVNARLHGIKDMHFYDLYLPPEFGFDIKLPFRKAYEVVIDCLKVLGEEYGEVLKKALDERWIDPYENEGKSSGAYSWGTYDSHPYVLTNYKEDLDHLQTVAHEMGHSLHTWYSNKNQPYAKSGYSLFVAEVASTVNEVLVLRELMDRYPQDEAQAYLLYNLLDSFRGTVFRQTMFAEFEKNAHEMAEKGEPITSETLNEMYGELNKKYYANLEYDELIAYEWMRIPHFYNCFYVYKYATGFSAAMAIAGKIRKEGLKAVEDYKKFLSAGCSVYPIDALKLAGVDLSKPETVNAALNEFEELLDKYEKVCKRINGAGKA